MYISALLQITLTIDLISWSSAAAKWINKKIIEPRSLFTNVNTEICAMIIGSNATEHDKFTQLFNWSAYN